MRTGLVTGCAWGLLALVQLPCLHVTILCHHGAVLPTASRGDEVELLGSALCVLVHWVFNPISQAYPGMPGPKKVSLKPYNLEEDKPGRTR